MGRDDGEWDTAGLTRSQVLAERGYDPAVITGGNGSHPVIEEEAIAPEEVAGRRCEMCGRTLGKRQKRFCGRACRDKALGIRNLAKGRRRKAAAKPAKRKVAAGATAPATADREKNHPPQADELGRLVVALLDAGAVVTAEVAGVTMVARR